MSKKEDSMSYGDRARTGKAQTRVEINGVELSADQTTVLRMALMSFHSLNASDPAHLGSDAGALELAAGYRDTSREILGIIMGKGPDR